MLGVLPVPGDSCYLCQAGVVTCARCNARIETVDVKRYVDGPITHFASDLVHQRLQRLPVDVLGSYDIETLQ